MATIQLHMVADMVATVDMVATDAATSTRASGASSGSVRYQLLEAHYFEFIFSYTLLDDTG